MHIFDAVSVAATVVENRPQIGPQHAMICGTRALHQRETIAPANRTREQPRNDTHIA